MGTMRSTVTDEITRASDPGASRRRLPGERGLRSAACLLVCGLVQIASVARGQGTLPPTAQLYPPVRPSLPPHAAPPRSSRR